MLLFSWWMVEVGDEEEEEGREQDEEEITCRELVLMLLVLEMERSLDGLRSCRKDPEKTRNMNKVNKYLEVLLNNANSNRQSKLGMLTYN